MKIRTAELNEVQGRLPAFIDAANNGPGHILITRNGVIVAALMGEGEFFHLVAVLLAYREREEADGVTVN